MPDWESWPARASACRKSSNDGSRRVSSVARSGSPSSGPTSRCRSRTSAADFAGQGRPLAEFGRRLATYRRRRHGLESDPRAPQASLVTRSAVQIGLAAAHAVPGLGVAAGAVNAAATAELVDRPRAYLRKKFRSSQDVRLLLSPAEVLSKALVADLRALAARQTIALFFDTFERTAPFLEGWLLDLL